MSKHTPGPWAISADHGKLWIETSGSDGTICEIHKRQQGGSVYACKEASANARLIAAAPDLLRMVEKFVSDYGIAGDGWPINKPIFIESLGIIAKARGEK